MSMQTKQVEALIGPVGDLSLKVIRGSGPKRALSMKEIVKYAFPHAEQSDEVNEWRLANIRRREFISGVKDAVIARRISKLFGLAHMEGTLFGKVIRASGEELDLGLMGLNIVTTTGVNFLGDALRNTVEPETMKYHGIGTGSTGEVIGNTALGTEATTQYNPDSTRATGSLAGSNNVFTTVGTNTVDASFSPTEWGLFSQAATGGGTMLDRVTFSAVALASGDSLQTTFSLTFTAGG